MALPSLEVTEKWIRNRVGLDHENLEDVKSLALPGTYHEKITHLGTSLLGFTRLKSLDLSRNGLVSLSGLAHLKMLERLNIYYNNIKTLEEVHLLRHNSSLQELDLRLNPVTKNEVDYRLFVIHLLPNLRKLDDRSVRDGERNSAILHFDTDQANEMASHGTDRVSSDQKTTPNHSLSRAEQIRKLGRYPSALDDDDNELLDLLAKTGGDLSKPYPLSGSEVKSGSYQPHSKEDIRIMESKATRPNNLDVIDGDRTTNGASISSLEGGRLQPGSVQYGPVSVSRSSSQHTPHQELTNGVHVNGQVHFQEANNECRGDASNYGEEAYTYTSYTSKGHFTPNPKAGNEPQAPKTPSTKQPLDEEGFKEPPLVHRMFEHPSQSNEESRSPFVKDACDDLLMSLLHIVDRYWNGSKSLHYHSKFQAQARHIIKSAFLQNLASHQSSPARNTEEKMKRLEAENEDLREEVERKRSSGGQLHRELETGLQNTQGEVQILQSKLQESMEQNNLLQRELLKTREHNGVIPPYPTEAEEGLRRELDTYQRENEKLNFQIKHFKQLQELAIMLQESHKSLVTTNDHLLKEMDEMKRRHLQEVKQLNWSYKEMKNTMKVIAMSDQNHNPV